MFYRYMLLLLMRATSSGSSFFLFFLLQSQITLVLSYPGGWVSSSQGIPETIHSAHPFMDRVWCWFFLREYVAVIKSIDYTRSHNRNNATGQL